MSDEPEPSDAELLERFRRGDAGAFDSLVLRHLDFVVRHAARFVGDRSSAEDVAQEVFVRVYRSSDLYREDRSFRGWLVSITTRLALNELRTRRRRQRNKFGGADTQRGRGAPTGEGRLLEQERARAVHEALARLPLRQRLAVSLQTFEGWDLREIGSALELSVAAVKSLLFRARRSLLGELAWLVEPGVRDDGRVPPLGARWLASSTAALGDGGSST